MRETLEVRLLQQDPQAWFIRHALVASWSADAKCCHERLSHLQALATSRARHLASCFSRRSYESIKNFAKTEAFACAENRTCTYILEMCVVFVLTILLSRAILAVRARPVVTSELSGLEPHDWAAGTCWLQDSYAVLATLATENAVNGAGPLTDGMQAEDFTDFQVPFGANVFAFFGLLSVLLAAHEAYTAASKKPLLADHGNSNNFLIQLMFLILWFGFFVNSSLIVPLSLDYAIAMGQSATASGVFLGCGTILSVIGLVVGRSLNSETSWDQAFARQTYIVCNSLSVALNLLLAFLTQASVHWSLPARQQSFWWSQLLLGSVFGAAALPTITWNTLWNKITPPQEKTFWMIMAQCCRNGGFLLGPPFFALISSVVRRGRDVSWHSDARTF